MSRHFLFVTWDGGGTVPPELSVTRALVERGHRVTVLADPTIEPEASAAGAGFRSWREAPYLVSRRPEDDLLRDFEARTPPQLVARLSDRLICGPAALQAAETAQALGELRPDVVVASAFLLGPQMAAEAEELPVAALLPNIYPFPAPGLPPFGTGWRPARGVLGRARDAAMARLGGRLWARALPQVNAARATLGLAPLAAVWQQLDRADRVLVLTSPSFDFPARPPANVRYVGPRLVDPAGRALAAAAGRRAAGARLAQRRPPGPARAAAADRGGDRGHARSRGRHDGQRDRPRGAGRAGGRAGAGLGPAFGRPGGGRGRRQPRGHGTVIKALAAGVPQLVVPMGRDQLDNAARVTARGAGLRRRPGASGRAIAAAVRRLPDEPSHREGARAMAARLRSERGRDAAADELEELRSLARAA